MLLVIIVLSDVYIIYYFILCSYRLEIYGRKYQWLIMGTYNLEWWTLGDPENNCTAQDLERALEQTILTDLLPLATSGEITVSGIVST